MPGAPPGQRTAAGAPRAEPLLELRAPLVRHLPQVAEPALRLVPLTLLLELRGQLVLLDRTPL